MAPGSPMATEDDSWGSQPPPDAIRMAPYSLRAPSPPPLNIPVIHASAAIHLTPSAEGIDPTMLTTDDVLLITGGKPHLAATDHISSWRYEDRRMAQPILDFLYLGPVSVVRDDDFLRREAISMIIVARDARMAETRLISVDAAATRRGILCHFVDFESPSGLINAWFRAVRLINHHLLAFHHAYGPSRRGKVLVTCETGNDRSAAIVVAYLMALFGADTIQAIQFIMVQRFCCFFDEDAKRLLAAWYDILKARCAVASQPSPHDVSSQQPQAQDGCWPTPAFMAVIPEAKVKRGIDDVTDVLDADRFIGREYLAPFGDKK
ncbi:hypothetical protein CP533_1625 [Ophiocordyceps camponoti-saundersi (nom. inval.)]|nr:hypothetical protein CP533_1625 [Ophiocordyceps camponoti-saundersi (nom. inval.)]